MGERSTDAAGVAETDGRLANRDLSGVSERCRRQPARAAQLEHGDVVLAVVADEIGRVVAPANGAGDDVGTCDDVVVRQHDAAGIDDDSRSGSDRLLVVDPRRDLDDSRLDRGGGRRCICGSGNCSSRCDQGQDRGKRHQQRCQRAAQE